MQSTYAQYRFYTADPVRSAARVAAEPEVKRDTSYYQAHIGKVKTVDDFVGNYRLFSYAMKAYGLGDSVQNRGFMRKVLTSDLTDPKSFVNKLTDPRYKTFALAYSFTKDGKVANTAVAQDPAQQNDTLARFKAQTLVGPAQSADATYYATNIGSVTSLDGLIGNQRLYRIALEAYGIDPDATPVGTIRKVLESDTSDPRSFVNASGSAGDGVQSAADMKATISGYASAMSSNPFLAAQATTETAYYVNAMPAVKDVDGFLSDDRLVAYAGSAYGLDFSTPAVLALAKANGADVTKPLSAAMRSDILRAALTSDLSNDQSVARTLGGGFAAAAAAYGFGPSALQSAGGMADAVSRYAAGVASDAASQTAAARETAYYQATVPTLTSAAQFLADPRLVAYAEQAYGLAFPAGTAPGVRTATLQAALTGDPTDPAGAAAKAGTAFVTFASAFTSARVVNAQAADAAESTIDLYAQAAGSTADASTETQYVLGTMPSIKSAAALVADPRLSAYVATAYGIAFPAGATDADKAARLAAILTSDPASAGATYGDAARRLAAAFQFGSDGAVAQGRNALIVSGLAASPPAAVAATVDLYTERLGTDAATRAAGLKESQYYAAKAATVTNVDDFVADPRLVAYAAKAYGISFAPDAAAAQQAAQLKAILTSDVDDPKSAASTVGDPARRLAAAFTFNATYRGDAAVSQNAKSAYAALAAAFNFDGHGAVTDPRQAQSAPQTQIALATYLKQTGGADKAGAQANAAYFATAIAQVKTVDGFLSDPRLVAVATAAYGVTRPANLSDAQWTAKLRGALTSDVSDPKSAASQLGTAFRAMAAGFNFAADGSVTRDPAQLAQSRKAAVLLADPYVQQAMVSEANQQNTGVGLALYFGQKAPSITDAYQILADKSLLTVVQKAFNLPVSMSMLNVDTQARVINDALKIGDLKDPKKVATVIQHFAARYDFDNSPAGTTSPLLTLFGGKDAANAGAMLTALNPTQQVDTSASSPLLKLFGGS